MTRTHLAAWLTTLTLAGGTLAGQQPKFYADDPLRREPETADASKVVERDIVLSFDLAENLFATPGEVRKIKALNLNTIDEVPDSSWFTNRIGARPVSIEEAVRGPVTGPGPAPGPLTVTRAKPSGVSAGFVLRDSAGETWFAQFDAAGYDEAASGAAMVANKLFHALGYWQTENQIAELDPDKLSIGDRAVTETPSGKIRRLDRDDLMKLLKRAARQKNGTYRMLVSRGIANTRGRFRYYGTARRRPQRPGGARAPARVARLEGVRRLDQPRRHEGQEHARRAGHRERAHGSASLPAGRGVDIRHRCTGSARLGRRTRAALRGRPDVEADGLARLLPQAVAEDPLRGAPVDRALRGRCLRSAGVEAARAHGRLPQRARRRQFLGRAPGDGVFGRA